MNRQKITSGKAYGDMLDGGYLTDSEWAELKAVYLSSENDGSNEFKKKVTLKCKGFYNRHIQSDPSLKGKCTMCGEEVYHKKAGICRKCYRAIRDKNTLRFAGNTREVKLKDVNCAICSKTPTYAKGLCRNCYRIYKENKMNSISELKEYFQARDKKMKLKYSTKRIPLNVLTKLDIY